MGEKINFVEREKSDLYILKGIGSGASWVPTKKGEGTISWLEKISGETSRKGPLDGPPKGCRGVVLLDETLLEINGESFVMRYGPDLRVGDELRYYFAEVEDILGGRGEKEIFGAVFYRDGKFGGLWKSNRSLRWTHEINSEERKSE